MNNLYSSGGNSSSMIVPVPGPVSTAFGSATPSLVTDEASRNSENVSSNSRNTSSLIVTVAISIVSPGSNVNVPAVAS